MQLQTEEENKETVSKDCQVQSNIRNTNKKAATFCWPPDKMVVPLGFFYTQEKGYPEIS